MDKKFILVQAPDSAILHEQEWFDMCYHITELDAVAEFGDEAYFVPEKLFNTLMLNEEA
jgi:hypothetical protein